MEAARVFLEMHQRDGDQLFSRIVTGDESWVHHSTPETKRQNMVWKKPEESAPKKAKVTISAGKVMAMENFKWKIFTHPPHSPELAPSDFHLYPALKWHLGGKHFANDDEVQAEANHWLLRQDTAWYNSDSRQDHHNEGDHNGEGKKTVQIEKRERAKMEEQINPSNDTAEQTIPKQETTFEEEETSPPQDNSADPLTQIADALSKLLSFFDNFDAQADRAELTYTDRLRKLPCYLQARQRLIDLFPATTEASFARFLAIKLTPQMPLEDYYQNKTVMGMKLDLPADILIESLTDGLPVADQRLIATVQPNTIKEWFDIVSRIRGTQCATSAVYQRQVDKAPHPTYHHPPPRYNNQRPSRVTYQVTPPPSPCKYCNAMHWHSQCEQRFPRDRTRPVYSARPRTTTVPKRGTHNRPKVQSPSHVPQVQAASQDDSTSPASSSTYNKSYQDFNYYFRSRQDDQNEEGHNEEEDADYQRILWKPSPEEPVVDYRLLTVTYSTTSAPFLAMRTLQQLAEDEGQNYPEASRVTLNDFYVDDLLTGAQTIAETKELIDQLKDLMKKGGFHLRKWNSNCHEIVSHVEEINEEKKINLEKGAISKILGILWDHVQDTFRVNITLPEEVVTKRDLLSNIARIFDPIGFLSPTTVAMANLQRQTAVKEVEDLEGLPVYHRAILKENGEWPEVTKAIQCSYPKVFVGDGTHLYLLIEDVESLDGPNVRSVLYQYHIPHKKWIWRKVNGFAPIVISKSIVYASHDKRVYFVGGRMHSRGNKVTCTDNIVRVKLKEGRASVLVKSRESPLTDLLVLAMTFAPSAFLFMLAETRDHSTYKVFSYHLLNKDWHLIGSDKIFWKEKFLCLQICYTNKKLLLFPRMQWEQHFCNLYNYRLQTDSWGCYTTIPILGEKEGYPKNINHFTIVQDWVRAVFVHAGKESKYLWKLNLKSKQWTELPTYVKYRDSQYTAVALDLVFILGPADKEHETAEKYLSFFKTRSSSGPQSTIDLMSSLITYCRYNSTYRMALFHSFPNHINDQLFIQLFNPITLKL
ncbi:hypothetical protein LAZ67_11001400 [Cordylochernes scorpioides]|uniref:Uncharacterized protein n=1 Tax=Cordylochernes scorpioides TaxID=51811 RepID=A0ABY6KZ51_9ARAC|nr:hypothetical protein LAZ67_11001400 [Cordylochernes scorpioides]